MDFLKIIKKQLADPRLNHPFLQKHSISHVDAESLYMLVDDYEKLNSEYRIQNPHSNVMEHLHKSLIAAYHTKDRNADSMWIEIMETMTPLIREHNNALALQKISDVYSPGEIYQRKYLGANFLGSDT